MTTEGGIPEEPGGGQDHPPYRPVFSLVMGVIAPVLCIALQPILPSGVVDEISGLRFLDAFPFLSYGVVALNILAMATWLGLGCRVGKWGGVVAGRAVRGLPFRRAARSGAPAFQLDGSGRGRRGARVHPVVHLLRLLPQRFPSVPPRPCPGIPFPLAGSSALLGAVLVVGIPGVQTGVSWAIVPPSGHLKGDPNATGGLRRLPPVVYRDRLVWAYQVEQDRSVRSDSLKRTRICAARTSRRGSDCSTIEIIGDAYRAIHRTGGSTSSGSVPTTTPPTSAAPTATRWPGHRTWTG